MRRSANHTWAIVFAAAGLGLLVVAVIVDSDVPAIFGIALFMTCGWPLRHELEIGDHLRKAVRRLKGS
ncbi:MAG TPA: hypothetical protein VMH33_02345 [Solirubrobacterales bacterium]|nr:hypothetical protein [Solirubrobacterales bacterium]